MKQDFIVEGTFRQSMNWLHTWAGLVLGWVLFFMFITGSAGYFDDEISRWMQPNVVIENTAIEQDEMLVLAEKRLIEVGDDSPEWFVDFPIGREAFLSIWWQEEIFLTDEEIAIKVAADNYDPEEKHWKWHDEVLDQQTGQPIKVRETAGGRSLYRMHYALHYIPTRLAYWLTSLSSMFMLVALITGIIIHKKIFIDFFTFRTRKGQKSWLDMHNLLSVLPLPFHLMITYSGLIFLMFTTIPAPIAASYGTEENSREPFFDELFPHEEHKEAAGVSAEMISMSTVFADAQQRWNGAPLRYIGFENRHDINAHLELSQYGYSGLDHNGQELIYDGVSGQLQHDLAAKHIEKSAAVTFYDVMINLHEGLFSNSLLRWLYFFSGLAGAGMIATGMILWVHKRRTRAQKAARPSKGLIMVEYTNLGAIVGFPIAIAAYFWANRLIPITVEHRDDWEMNTLFITWGLMLIYSLFSINRYTINQAWIKQLSFAAIAFALLPLLNAISSQHNLIIDIINNDWMMAGFDLSMIGIGVCFGFAAHILNKKEQASLLATTSQSKNKLAQLASKVASSSS